jgi:hypothetical protein
MKRAPKPFAACTDNRGNEASLILGKVYRIRRDARAAKDHLIRVTDESGDEFLFAEEQFVLVDFPQAARETGIPNTSAAGDRKCTPVRPRIQVRR